MSNKKDHSSPTTSVIPMYNPRNQSREELIERFVVRKKLFHKLYKDIKSSSMEYPEQHILIEGKRGMGKTTLLLRLCYEVEQDETLRHQLIPLVFNEEEYSVRKLFRFWERIIEMLEDHSPAYQGLLRQVQTLSKQFNSDTTYEKELFNLLKFSLQQNEQKLLLLIDNFGDMFQKFSDKEAHRLRKILQTSKDIRIIAASSVVLESFYIYKHPFYEFFKIEKLEGLKAGEAFELFTQFAKQNKTDKAQQIVTEQKNKIETLRRLSGGVIRTMILLFEILLDDPKGNAFLYLENILDRVTPLYKHRMDKLPTQQQQIVEAIALSWDAVSVREISHKIRMKSKVISAQLNQLVKSEVVVKIKTNTKNHLYQINERFFNIWYLMRHGRTNDRLKVLWLVRFLEEWCDEKEIVVRAKQHVAKLKKGQYPQRAAWLVSEALAFTKQIPKETQHHLLSSTRTFLDQQKSNLLSRLSNSDFELQRQAMLFIQQHQYESALNVLLKMKDKDFFQIGFIYSKGIKNFKLAKSYYQKAINKGSLSAMNNLGVLLEYHFKKPEEAKQLYERAMEGGNQQAIYNLALLYKNKLKLPRKAAQLYQKAAEKGDADAMYNLGNLYTTNISDPQNAITYFKMAAENGHAKAMSNLAFIYTDELKNYALAEHYFKQALTNGLFEDEAFLNISSQEPLNFHFLFLLSRKQYDFLYDCFNSATAERNQLKERLKPIYYALMNFLSEKHPGEHLRMGPELEETVKEIENAVKILEKEIG